jgi:phosphoribosyl-dephospho-CoA transferase
MGALQRHDLVWLDAAGWRAVLQPADEPGDDEALDCLRHWARHDLPLVVTRQAAEAAAGWLMLGLAAPQRWGRRRLFVGTQAGHVKRVGAFPPVAELTAAHLSTIQPTLQSTQRAHWAALCEALAALRLDARVFGSHGWQLVSGLPCVRAGSDIDLLLPCADLAQADAVVALLQACGPGLPRLDGEIVRPDGAAVAWREWAAWREGSTRQLLVKRLHGAALENPAAWAA